MSYHWHDDECGWCPCDEPDRVGLRVDSDGMRNDAPQNTNWTPAAPVPAPDVPKEDAE